MAPADRGRQRDQDDLGTFAAYPQDPVAVFLAEIGDVRGGGFEDPQAQQAEHGHQREVARVRRFPGGGQQGLELQVGESQGGRLGRDDGTAHVLGGRMLQDAIKSTGPVEPGRDREPPGHGGGLEPADLLHPPDVQLQVRPPGGQRVQALLGTPGEVAAQV
jgi:hypothetical protein